MWNSLQGLQHQQAAPEVSGAPTTEVLSTPMGVETSFFSESGNATAAVRPAPPPPTTTFINRPPLPGPPSAFLADFPETPAMQQQAQFRDPVGSIRPPDPPKYGAYPGTPPGEASSRLFGGYTSPSPIPPAPAQSGQIPPVCTSSWAASCAASWPSPWSSSSAACGSGLPRPSASFRSASTAGPSAHWGSQACWGSCTNTAIRQVGTGGSAEAGLPCEAVGRR